MNIKEEIKNLVYQVLEGYVEKENIVIENPKDRKMGDYALPCFTYAKAMHKSPLAIAEDIKNVLNSELFEKVEVVNGYVNVFINKKLLTKEVINQIIDHNSNFGNSNIGEGKTIVIDYSSPNIAKPFGVGHLRSTVIGNALRNICEKNGYKVISINYLGDWGTQFGKLVYAYKKWGNEEAVRKNPIDELKRLYVKFHEEAENDPSLDDEGRKAFKMLEDKDPESLRIWKWFSEESIKEFNKTYDLLGINNFDSWQGESFYNDKMDRVVEELENKNLLEESEGAMIVKLDGDISPALIKRSDGATLYITRDLAAAIYRKENYQFDEALYVVGNEQTLHFNQLKQVLTKLDYDWSKDVHHIPFGMILQNGKKMSTRQGKSVKLHDVLVEAISLANKYIDERNSSIPDKENISHKIGVGAVIFNDLKNYRTNDIEFNLEDILKFEGETGPYIQYTYARIISLLNNRNNQAVNFDNVNINEYQWYLIFKLYQFKDTVIASKVNYDPSLIAKYLIDIAQDFNKWYASEKFIDEAKEETEARLLVAYATSIILKEGMRLLGIEALNKM
ncbi:MAG: arginine--tRNA ligase [Firmicutes bacterium]|nr:arginine--tRNA ligase [Bacillota bacterium]